MNAPTRTQIQAAIETLSSAGWTISGPSSERCVLLSPGRVAELLDVSVPTARRVMEQVGALMLPGGDLRCRAANLERWLDERARPTA